MDELCVDAQYVGVSRGHCARIAPSSLLEMMDCAWMVVPPQQQLGCVRLHPTECATPPPPLKIAFVSRTTQPVHQCRLNYAQSLRCLSHESGRTKNDDDAAYVWWKDDGVGRWRSERAELNPSDGTVVRQERLIDHANQSWSDVEGGYWKRTVKVVVGRMQQTFQHHLIFVVEQVGWVVHIHLVHRTNHPLPFHP